jgi:hypothetical protein
VRAVFFYFFGTCESHALFSTLLIFGRLLAQMILFPFYIFPLI